MFGCDSPEDVARSVTDIAKDLYVHPERRGVFLREAIEGGATVNVENEYRRKDGSTFTGQLNLRVAHNSIGELVHIDGFVQDISERRRAEEAIRNGEQRFRAIFEAAQDAICLKDRNLCYVQVNSATERLFLYSAESIVGRTAQDLFGRETTEAIDEADRRVLSGEVSEEESLPPRKTGGHVPLSIIRVPLRDQNGDIVGVCAIARDITERRRLEEQLRQAQKMETVGRLAGGIAQDFNNLLTAITANAEFALAVLNEGHPARGDIEQVKQAAQKAGALTRQLLAFSRR